MAQAVVRELREFRLALHPVGEPRGELIRGERGTVLPPPGQRRVLELGQPQKGVGLLLRPVFPEGRERERGKDYLPAPTADLRLLKGESLAGLFQ